MTSSSADSTTARARTIDGLRQLADYLDVNPDLPVDEFGWTFQVHPAPWRDDALGRAEIERIATLMGVTPASTDNTDSDWIALKRFGLITYAVVYVSASRMRSYDALMSYSGSISADPTQAASTAEAA